jgi:colicin import membrane protein
MSNLIKIDNPELSMLEKSKAEKIRSTFEPMANMLSEFEARYNELMAIPIENITPEICSQYKRFRLDVAKVRIETGKAKDQAKEYLKLEDKAIMGVHNILVFSVKEMEDKAKEREQYFEIQEQKRLEALQLERAEKLSLYVEDAHDRDLSKFEDDEFEALLVMKKKQHEDRIEAEKKAEAERIAKEKAEAEERERIRKENEKLKKEAEERERLAKIEADKRAKEERERLAKAEAERKEREEKERKEREAHEAELRKEREEKERMQRELAAKAEAERKAAEQEEAKRQAELTKGDADKVADLINDLEFLKTKYSFKSARFQKKYADTCILIDKVINHINK